MKISVVIPTYKRPHLLSRLLDSIKIQTHPPDEIIIVDDNSPQVNEYVQVIKKHQNHLRLTYLRNDKNLGSCFSRNRGILQTTTDFIALVDDDDEWHPQKIEKQIEILHQNKPRLGLVYTWTKAVKFGQVVYEYNSEFSGCPLNMLLIENFIPSSSVMLNKKAIIDAGLFDEKMPSCEDWDLWTRLLIKGYNIDVVKSYLTIYHKHDEESIGHSPTANIGYERFYQKHLSLYRKLHKKMYFKMKIKSYLKPFYRRFKDYLERRYHEKNK